MGGITEESLGQSSSGFWTKNWGALGVKWAGEPLISVP